MTGTKHPEFHDLSQTNAQALLKRNHFGRLAYAFHDRVDIEPITYVFADHWIYGRTSAGTKLTTLLHHPWVAFEVDEVEDRFNWKSVVVHGAIYCMTVDDANRTAYDAAVAAIRTIDRHALTVGDATPDRIVVLGFHADEIVGRASRAAR